MSRATWPLLRGRPIIEIVLTLAKGGQPLPRRLLADTGAGSRRSGVELLLSEDDILLCGGVADTIITLGGAYAGSFQTYFLPVQIPALGFHKIIRVVAVPS